MQARGTIRQFLIQIKIFLLAPKSELLLNHNFAGKYGVGTFQSFVVLDYRPIGDSGRYSAVEAMSSTTRNQSCSQLQTGANQKEGAPTLREDEHPP